MHSIELNIFTKYFAGGLSLPMKATTGYYIKNGKRQLDLLLSAPAFLVLSPVLGLIAILIRLTMGSPVIFKQVRPGLGAVPFSIIKFRTMTNARDAHGKLLPNAQRTTRLGRFLRTTSLDELPTLLNVLKGQMSLVGPRPLLMHYLDRYSAEQARRHEVKPGLSGWAQIHGRNAISWDRKFCLDLWYVDNRCLRLDIRIIAITIKKIIFCEDIVWQDEITMPEFNPDKTI
jgi:sugar transferase EpsL